MAEIVQRARALIGIAQLCPHGHGVNLAVEERLPTCSDHSSRFCLGIVDRLIYNKSMGAYYE